jgi:PAS domain S-box-containing protein
LTAKRPASEAEIRIQQLEEALQSARHSEAAARESLARYRIVAENLTDIVWTLDQDLKATFVTPSVQAHLGYAIGEVIGLAFPDTLTRSSRVKLDHALKTLHPGVASTTLDLEHVHQNGIGFWFESQLSGLFNPARELTGFICVSRNIDRRKQAESALQLSNALFQTAFAISPDAVTLNRMRDGVYTMVNEGFTLLTGYSREAVIGKTTEDIEIWADVKERQRLMAALDEAGSIRNLEAHFRVKDGRIRTGLVSANIVILNRQPYVMSITKDIDNFKKAKEALTESEAKYRTLIETATDAIFILQDGEVKFPNPRAREMARAMGIDLKKHAFFEYVAPEDQNMVLERHFRRLKGDKVPSTYNFRLLRASGEAFWVEINAVKILWEGKPATLNFIRDIDDQVKLEAEFQHARKMEAVGTLAHNFNNLLMAIQGNVSLLLLDTPDGDQRHEEMIKIQEHVESGSRLTSQLLGYARKGKYRIRSLDLNGLIAKTVASFRQSYPTLKLTTHLATDLDAVAGDRTQLEHVLFNTFKNAVDAMPDGGELFVKTLNIGHKQIRQRNYKIKAGEYIMMVIADNGVGMEQKVRRRIFEPFFTTKEIGRGTGLGLASVYGIIKGHGGYIDVDSQRGHGTTFFIYLPISSRPMEKTDYKDKSVIHGSGCILVVDDEPAVLEISSKMLQKLGFRVLEASSGHDALNVYRQNRRTIDLVLLDMIMPDIGGGEVYEHLKEINRNVKVILATGYSLDGEASLIMKKGCDGVIQKPFSIDRLSRMISRVLKRPEATRDMIAN